MSLVKLKNSLARLLASKVGTDLPHGTTFDTELRQGRLSVYIACPAFDLLKPGKLTLTDHGYQTCIAIFRTGEDSDYTHDAEAIKAKVQELCAGFLTSEGATGKVYVGFASSWIAAQARRMRQEAQASAAPAEHTAAA